jgi:hypothetical protein
MKQLIIFLTVILGVIPDLFSSNGNDVIGARSLSLGGFSTTLSDVWSANNNQAGLGFVDQISGGLSYESRFLLKEIAYKSGAFALPTKLGAFGLTVTSFGYSAYNETKAGLSYGQKLNDKIALGVQLNYTNVKIGQEYGQKSALTGAIGLIANLSKEIAVGVHVYNPTRTKFADYNNERLPTIMKLGLDYKFSEKVFLAVETEKDIDFGAIARVGIEYNPIDILYLRGGISTNPTLSSFGFGLKLKDFKLDLSTSFHQTLGITPGISIIYTAGK